MEEDIRSSSGQDRRHWKQQRSCVKDPFRGGQLGPCDSVWKEAFGSRTLHGGNLLTGVKSLSALCCYSVSVEAQQTDAKHMRQMFPFMKHF